MSSRRPIIHCALTALLGACMADPSQREDVDSASAVAELVSIRAIADMPSYWGSDAGSLLCTKERSAGIGYEPSAGGPYPLFLLFVGTFADFTKEAAHDMLRSMAERGYVAVSVQYDNGLPVLAQAAQHKSACLFDPNRNTSLVSVLCARSNVRCDAGITVWGHSQGGATAMMAGSFDGRVRGAWTTGYGFGWGTHAFARTTLLPHERARSMLGADEGSGNLRDQLVELTGIDDASCGASHCLKGPVGGGWWIVQKCELAQNKPEHSWYGMKDLLTYNVDPMWYPGTGTTQCGVTPSEPYEFSVPKTADFLARTQALGPVPAHALAVDFAGYDEYASLPVALADAFPWGLVDWGTSSNARVLGPISNLVDANHMVIGTGSAPASASFRFASPQGMGLRALDVQNVGGLATLTVQVTDTRGVSSSQSLAVPAAPSGGASRVRLAVQLADDARAVRITSSTGDQLKIRGLTLYGRAALPVPNRALCPAARVLLRAAANDRYVAVDASSGALKASASGKSAAAVFSCSEPRPGQVTLGASDGRVVAVDGARANAPLVLTGSAGPSFSVLELGGGTWALRSSVTGDFVTADLNLWGAPLVSNRSTLGGWEQLVPEAP